MNLLRIEQNFLNLPEVKAAMNLSEIRTIQRAVDNSKKKKFEQSLALAEYVAKAYEWFKSDQAKQIMEREGLSWNTEEFSLKTFGYQKSFFHKLVRASKVTTPVVEDFKSQCETLESEGKQVNRSIEELLKFAKAVEEGTANSGGEGEEGEGEGEGAQVQERPQVLSTFVWKQEGGNISVRVMSDGSVKTTNSQEEIFAALATLQSLIANANI